MPRDGVPLPVGLDWAYRGQQRSLSEAANGRLLYDTGFSESRGKETVVTVSYQDRTWRRAVAPAISQLPPAAEICDPMVFVSEVGTFGTAADLRSLILPMRLVVDHPGNYVPVKGERLGLVPVTEVTASFRWLPLTTADLKLLTPPIPAGFRQLSGQG